MKKISLRTLVIITCIALLGIIALQVFWLFKSYADQKKQLSAELATAMLETHILTGVSPGINEVAKDFVDDILQTNNEAPLDMQPEKRLKKSDKIKDLDEQDKKIIESLTANGRKQKEYTINTYKEQLDRNLKAKQIDIPFELALTDLEGKIMACTIDSLHFKKISFKSDAEYSLIIVRLNAAQTGRMQLAVPGAALYLLKVMALVLSLSLIFTLVCLFSFFYMVTLFFRQKKIAEIRNDFMHNMTHELKTPISAASIALELLQDETTVMTPLQQKEYFTIAQQELDRLTLLIDKVLKMAAFEKMEVRLSYETFAVKPWLMQIIDAHKPTLAYIRSDIRLAAIPDTLLLHADKTHLTHVIQNLLDNAVKYRNTAQPVLMISMKAGRHNNHFVFEITDNGIGISAAYKDKIFEKFFRVPTGDQHDTKGHGLGLSYASEIVKLHQGTITMTSDMQNGSTFTLSIPLQAD